jgi:hypothetical protein
MRSSSVSIDSAEDSEEMSEEDICGGSRVSIWLGYGGGGIVREF